jgi:transcriptional regulator with XRE-family HTH domain
MLIAYSSYYELFILSIYSFIFDGDDYMQPILIPEKLKMAREQQGITKLEAARRMNIPQSSYVRYENGGRKPTYATITQMAQVLGTSVDFLTGKTEESVAETMLVRKEEEPILYEITAGAKEFNEVQMNRLLAYYRELSNKVSIDK